MQRHRCWSTLFALIAAIGGCADEEQIEDRVTEEQVREYCSAICTRRSEVGCQSIQCFSLNCWTPYSTGRCPDVYAKLVRCQARQLDVVYKETCQFDPTPCASEQKAYDLCK